MATFTATSLPTPCAVMNYLNYLEDMEREYFLDPGDQKRNGYTTYTECHHRNAIERDHIHIFKGVPRGR